MILYILSIVVFIAIASLIGFLLGRASFSRRLKRMEKDMESIQLRNKETENNHQELLDQLKIQGRELERSKLREQKLDEIVEKLSQEKKRLAAESNENRVDVINLRKRHEELSNKWAITETREREALRWKNEYVRLNYTLEDKLRRLELQLEQMQEASEPQDTIKENSEQEIDPAHGDVQKKTEGTSDLQPELAQIETLKDEMADLKIKSKRQEHIIRALRLQLKNLNIEKIRQTETEILEQQSEEEFDVGKGVDIEDCADAMVSENDFSEALDEITGQPDELFPESMSFKQQKLRKTGDEVLNFTRVHQRVAHNKPDRDKRKPAEESKQPSGSDINWKKILGQPAKQASNLSLIFNMNNATAKSLQTLGINSFEQLASVEPQHYASLEKELGIPFGTIEDEKWVRQAGNLISEENINSIFLRTRSNQDSEKKSSEQKDLTKIRGIGRTYKKRLESAGINSIADLSNWDEGNLEELAALISVPVEKIERERWLYQARQLKSRQIES